MLDECIGGTGRFTVCDSVGRSHWWIPHRVQRREMFALDCTYLLGIVFGASIVLNIAFTGRRQVSAVTGSLREGQQCMYIQRRN